MTITYPRPLPTWFRAEAFGLNLSRVQAVARTRGGAVQVAERGRTLWTAEITTPLLRPTRHEELQAWLASLRGGLNTFLLHHLHLCRPIAYPGTGWAGITRHGGGAFDGTATVTAASGYSVTVGDLPTNYVASPGDMISWAWGSTRTLHRVVEGGTASAGVLTVQVEPDVPAGGTYPATVKLERADAVFRLSAPVFARRSGGGGEPIQFQAIQALY